MPPVVPADACGVLFAPVAPLALFDVARLALLLLALGQFVASNAELLWTEVDDC